MSSPAYRTLPVKARLVPQGSKYGVKPERQTRDELSPSLAYFVAASKSCNREKPYGEESLSRGEDTPGVLGDCKNWY